MRPDNLVIFDFDGTIADSFDTFIEVTNCLAEEFNYPQFSTVQISRFRKLSLKAMVQELGMPKWKLLFFLRRFRQELSRLTPYLQPISGIDESLMQLNPSEYRLGIVTSNSRKNVEAFLQTHKLSHRFDFICGGQLLSGKAKTLKQIARRSGTEPRKIIFIGDEVGDVKAAKQVGLYSIAVSWGFNDRQILEQHTPDTVVDHPQQLISEIVQRFRLPADS